MQPKHPWEEFVGIVFLVLMLLGLMTLVNKVAFGMGSQAPKENAPESVISPEPIVTISNPSAEINLPAEPPKNRFHPVSGYSKAELLVLERSELLINQVLQSECFESVMLKRGLIQRDGLTPQDVVEKLRTTQKTIPLKMYDAGLNGVLGYRQPPSDTVYTNRPYVAGASACARSSNLTHEWSHTLGFGHDFKRTKRRPFSVPYSINSAFVQCCSCKGIMDCKVKQ